MNYSPIQFKAQSSETQIPFQESENKSTAMPGYTPKRFSFFPHHPQYHYRMSYDQDQPYTTYHMGRVIAEKQPIQEGCHISLMKKMNEALASIIGNRATPEAQALAGYVAQGISLYFIFSTAQ